MEKLSDLVAAKYPEYSSHKLNQGELKTGFFMILVIVKCNLSQTKYNKNHYYS